MLPEDFDPRGLNTHQRRHLLVELRKAGWSYDMIAYLVGSSRKKVFKELRAIMRRSSKAMLNSLSEIKQLERERLDAIIASLWPDMEAGSTRAAEVVLQAMKRRAEMEGLDEPIKTQNQTTSIDINVQMLPTQQLQEYAAELGIQLQPKLPAIGLLPGETGPKIEDAEFVVAEKPKETEDVTHSPVPTVP